MRVVIGTNVLISGLLSPSGPPVAVLDMWISGRINVCVSPDIVNEYVSVLLRPRFAVLGTLAERSGIITGLVELPNTTIVYPLWQLNVIDADPDDNIFLACAVEARAEVIVSGDEHLLALGEYQGIAIWQPAYFVKVQQV
ncbi:MAG: putative toxin-antitoxin system toxin component, PIN family [Desulfurispora sp.]|uniref:putative toxin-antitoxin system toxin component, PIN family n=1 Tax=Desulfurispora sp. TaxID=3014275 RepID=UPI00404ADF3B